MASETGRNTHPSVTSIHAVRNGTPESSWNGHRPWSLDDLPVAVLVFDGHRAIAVNERWTALTGLDLADSRGDGWLNAVHHEDRDAMKELPTRALRGHDAVGDWRLKGPGGRGQVCVQARAHHAGGTGPSESLMTLSEIDAHQTPSSRLVHVATHDALTGLLNQAAFRVEVRDALRRTTPTPSVTAVLFIDLDRFKQVNDRLGHQAGDTLLALASRRIHASLRSTESAGRLGGDEVGVLCPALESRRDAVRLAERIMAALAEPFTVHDELVRISASVGVAFSDGDSPTAAELVDHADQAMYRAKKQGRSRCVVFGSNDEPARWHSSAAEVNTSLAHLAVSVASDQRQIGELWDQSIDVRDEHLAERLSQVSRALHAADIALSDDDAIG